MKALAPVEAVFAVAQRLLTTPVATAAWEALGWIGPAFDADRAWLILLDEALQNFWVAYEWCAEGVPACLPDLPCVPVALIAHPLKSFLKGKAVVLADIEKLPPDAQVLKEEMRREGNRATAGAPLFRDGRLVALIGVDDTRKVHAWTAADMAVLRQLGELVLAAAERARAVTAEAAADGKGGHWTRAGDGMQEKALGALREVPRPQSGGCYLRAGNCHVQVQWEDIVAILAEGDHTRVRLRGGREFMELKALSVWESMLPEALFGRVHRSYIVGWKQVSRLRRSSGGRWTLELKEGAGAKAVPVGRNYQAAVRARINLRPV